MNAHTKARCVAIADEIRGEAFMAGKAKNPRAHFNRIHTLAKEACDYFAFGFEAPDPAAAPAAATEEAEEITRPVAELEVFSFTCGVPACPWDDYPNDHPGWSDMADALAAAKAHAAEHRSNA